MSTATEKKAPLDIIRGCVAPGSDEFDNALTTARVERAVLLQSLKALVEQFRAYENGWLGPGVWRIRIGLPNDLRDAEAIIRTLEGQ